MEARFENSDRMINYLLQQVSSLEDALQKRQKQIIDGQDDDRDRINRMKNDLKVVNEDAVTSINDLISKMAIVEDN
jgi:hypothetical protein